MRPIDRKLLEKMVKLAGSRLSGDWVVIGGTVLPLLGIEYRVTVDIDLVGTKAKQQEQVLELMTIAEELGLSVETINQAGAYFLHKIPDFKDHLVLLHEGPKARIFRPDLVLFIRLKIGRFSESDLTDCLEFLAFTKRSKEKIDRTPIQKLLQTHLKSSKNEERSRRIKRMLAAIDK